jgi:conjugal transfer ATP-binding protein TraC
MSVTPLKKLIRSRTRVPFFNKINLWSIVDRLAVGADLQMSAGFELSGQPDILLQEPAEVEVHNRSIQNLLHSIPEGTTLQFVIQARRGDPQKIESFLNLNRSSKENEALTKEILSAKKDHFATTFIQKRRYFLFVTTYADDLSSLPAVRWNTWAEKSFKGTTRELHETRVRALESIVSGIEDSLRNVRVHAERLSNKALADFYYRHLNPSRSRLVPCPDPVPAKNQSARSLLAESACQTDYGYFLLDGQFHQTLNLLILPDRVEPAALSDMTMHLSADYDLALTVHVVDSEGLIEKLKTQANIARALSFSNFGSHYEASLKYKELDELIKEIRATPQRLMTFSLCILLKDVSLTGLEEKTAYALKAFQEIGSARGILDHLNHEDLFLSILPNHSHLNSRKHVIHSRALSQFIPLNAPWTGTPVPKMLFQNPQGELVSLDLFDSSLPAKHALLVGTTGSGKSFATNYLLTQFFIESTNHHIIIIDVGGSYRKLCRLFNGRYLQVELSEEFAFNPLPEKSQIIAGKDLDPDELAYITLILERMVLDQDEALNSLGDAILEKAIRQAYRETQTPSLMEIRKALTQLSGDEEDKALANHFYKNLEMWTEGRYAQVFNSRRRLQIDNRLIVFDLERLASHPKLQAVYFYVIRQIIDSKLRNKALKKMIVVDEGWRFFNDDIGSRLIENLYRTARKSNGMILSISQSPADFLSTKAANAIITNSYVKYILRLTKGHELLPQLGFAANEIETIKQLNSVPRKYSDVYLKFNDRGAVLRLEPSALDYWICTTDADDSLKEEALRKDHPNWNTVQVITRLAKTPFQSEESA